MQELVLGIFAALLSAFSWASATILVRTGLKKLSPVGANILRLYVASTIFLTIFALIWKSGCFQAAR